MKYAIYAAYYPSSVTTRSAKVCKFVPHSFLQHVYFLGEATETVVIKKAIAGGVSSLLSPSSFLPFTYFPPHLPPSPPVPSLPFFPDPSILCFERSEVSHVKFFKLRALVSTTASLG